MSRSKKGRKAPGFEYWGRRPGKSRTPGPFTKRYTHRRERSQGKRDARKEY